MLKVLPTHISNLIAAGEVVQRPASVVKELMENAVDAGADTITVIINDCGRTLIQVIDNGEGMTAEEAALCFERHATSKIENAEDLYSIGTYGFRGEALASIAACADVTLKTRKREEETGTEIHIAESKIISSTPAACPAGSNFAVRNIFYNIPARRKFLKSDNAEYRQIVSEFLRVALTRLNIEFRLIHNGKDIFMLPPVENLKQRIIRTGGKDIAKDLIDTRTDTSVVSIRGFIGRPEFAKKSQPNQYLFVNGRYFKSPVLSKAILKAYANLIPEGTFPSYFIFLEIEPGSMDINIHPSKTEIKFDNENVIFEILNACVKEAIGENSFVPGIDFDTEGAPEIPPASAYFYQNSGSGPSGEDKTGAGKGNAYGRYVAPPRIDYDPLFNPFEEEKKMGRSRWNSPGEWKSPSLTEAGNAWENEAPGAGAEAAPPQEYYREENAYGGVFNEEAPDGRPILQLKGRYIVTTVKSGLLLIDAWRAKARILYERYLESLSSTDPAIQEVLYPHTIDLDHHSYSVLMENPDRLKSIGFDIRPFGKDCVVVYGLPASLADEELSIQECIDRLIAVLEDETGPDPERELKEKTALALVKAGGIRYDDCTGGIQARLLIDALFACKEPATAPDGGRCMTILPLEELVKKL